MDSAKDGILFMVCVKLSREMNAHGDDNLVDLCGYADLLNYAWEQEECQQPESAEKPLKT